MEKIGTSTKFSTNPERVERIGIVTDEAADLPREIIEKYKIAIVPVKLDWPELESLPGENTFQKMRELEKGGIKSFGKTSQPSPKDFLDKYNYQLERFDKIICVTITSKLSGTYNSAIQAKTFLTPEDQERVFIIDSLSASCGQALIVLKAIDLIENNRETEKIIEELEKFVPQVLLFLMLESPKWLENSGRISHLVAGLLRRMAQAGIRPLLAFKKGSLVPAGLKADAKDIPTVLFKQFEAKTRELRKEGKRLRAVVTHGDDPEGAQRLKEMIDTSTSSASTLSDNRRVENEFKNTEVAFLNIINNIVGAVTGPNTLVLAWCEI